MSAHEVLAALVPYLAPGEALTLPHNFAVALATERDGGPDGAPLAGSAPDGDFLFSDLKARYRKSDTWVRERFGPGAPFGEGYRLGRERVARREDVLAFDARQRGDAAAGPLHGRGPEPAMPLRGSSVPSLVERRRSGAGR